MAKTFMLPDLNLPLGALVDKTGTFADLKNQLNLALKEIMAIAVSGAKRVAPVNFGTLRGSIFSRLKFQQNVFIIELGSPVKYAGAMEEGFNMGGKMPPEGAILQWVKRKKLKPRGKHKRKYSKNPALQAKQVAFGIRLRLQRHGGPKKGPYKYLESGVRLAQTSALKIFKRRLALFERRNA